MKSEYIVVIAVVCLLAFASIEWFIRRQRAAFTRQDEYNWADAEDRIREMASDPERIQSMTSVMGRMEDNSPFLDMICRSAAAALRCPQSAISMIEADRQIWLSSHFDEGTQCSTDEQTEWTEGPLSVSYCKYVMVSDKSLVINNATQDPLVKDHACTTMLGMRAYLGTPVYSKEGFPVGSLCVFDFNPRKWSTRDRVTLESLASLVLV